jgi:hypothetical protein
VDDACPEEVPAEQVTLPDDTPEYPPGGLHVILAFGFALPAATKVTANEEEVPRSARNKAAHAAARSPDWGIITAHPSLRHAMPKRKRRPSKHLHLNFASRPLITLERTLLSQHYWLE